MDEREMEQSEYRIGMVREDDTFVSLEDRADYANAREAKSADYVVLTTTKMPSALVEVGFLSDAEERALLGQEEYQEKLAKGIAEAILDYLAE